MANQFQAPHSQPPPFKHAFPQSLPNSNIILSLSKGLMPQSKQPSSWDQIRNLLNCKQLDDSNIHCPSSKNLALFYTSCSKICTLRDVVVPGNTRVAHRDDKSPVIEKSGSGTPSSRHSMQLRKLSRCYESRSVVDPSKPPLSRINVFSCSECKEIFPKIESLELHQAVKHAVSELGADDSSRNIVEIIFKSSWLKKDNPICEIERVLKVHNTPRTIQRFEDYRAAVKLRSKRNPRCAADGNELLRFHAAAITCALGARGSSSLCGSKPGCGICAIIRHGFRSNETGGICTTSSSGRADDCLGGGEDPRRAMLVCRVIAGRVKQRAAADVEGSFDSLAGCAGAYSNMEEIFVFNSRAILPCFVVIYKALE